MFLCGIAVSQAYHYLSGHLKDSLLTKFVVWLTISCNVLHTISVCATAYRSLVTDAASADLADKFRLDWSIMALIALHLATATSVLLYYVQTCYRLLAERRFQRYITGILLVAIMVYLGSGIAVVVSIAKTNNIVQATPTGIALTSQGNTIFMLFVFMLSAQMAADILVSIALCHALPRPTHRGTLGVVQKVILYVVSRGILISVVALTEMMSIILAAHNFWFTTIEFVIPGITPFRSSLFSIPGSAYEDDW
ncbi:hypothetical protein BC629DRAFT_703822 [Irpex lacteus]|nr:hypothetical protein BC629DRAFT_703822 [Irpex lacteus]